MVTMRTTRAACVLMLGLLFLLWGPALAQFPMKMKAKAAPKAEKTPENLSPAEVDGYLAGLSDEEARRVLAAELKKSAAERAAKSSRGHAHGADAGIVRGFYGAQVALSTLGDQLRGMISGAQASTGTELWTKMVGGPGSDHLLVAVALIVLIVLVGLAAERLVLWKSEELRRQLLEAVPRGGWDKAGLFVSRLMLHGFGLAVYILVTFLAFFIIDSRWQTGTLVSSAVLLTYYFRLIELTARMVAAPKAPELRLVALSDSDARLLYRWIIWIAAAVSPEAMLTLALQKSGAGRELFMLVHATAGPIVSILLAIMIWKVRHRVGKAICPMEPEFPGASPLRRRCADVWHYPAIVFVLTVGVTWWANALIHGEASILRLVLSLFLVPLCIALDQWLQAMLGRLERKPREIIDFSVPEEAGETADGEPLEVTPVRRVGTSGKDMSIYFPLIRKAFRTVLLVFLSFAALELWGIELDLGWIFARNILGVLIALILGLIVWEVAKARIDQKLEEEMPFQSDEAEEGGAGGSRSGTLLMLLRKFILVVLFVVVGFSILASLGVNIAPLLAGAGVIGLAIGFGSQTLVKDIISGVFFLIDDAFRVGDYVEAGTAKGTVEAISLRSLRLRHPRGQVFIVPFGDLKLVKNFTRDYIIEKLDIRVSFDTDPDVVRKIVKKINKEIRKEEEIGNVLLSDIKSSGVRGMDDSAMILRVKFKCIPGEQFVLRREVYHRLQKAFKEKGIEFADRKVTVYVPPQPAGAAGTGPSGAQTMSPQAVGAAAAAAVMQAEAEALAKAAADKKTE